VARELGKVCIVGCERLAIDRSGQRARFGDQTVEEGDILTVDGAAGDVYLGTVEVVRERPTALLAAVAAWRTDEAERA
jgi:pyruvate,orthophosphate dikinase